MFASHGSLADGLLGAVEMIVGQSENTRAYSLDRYESPKAILEAVRAEVDAGGDVAILCDIKGGSVHNHLMELCQNQRVTLLTGMNLSMAVDLVSACEGSLRERCEAALRAGREDMLLFDREKVEAALASPDFDEL